MNRQKLSTRHRLALRWTGALAVGALLTVPLSGCGSNPAIGGTGGAGGTLATVGGESIDRSELNSYLETLYGESGLQQLIDYRLVMQKLKASGMDVTDAEVNSTLADRAKQNPMYAEALKTEGPRKQALIRQTRNELAINKLLTKDVKVNDAQLKTWFEKNRMRYDQPARIKMGLLATSQKVKADTMAQQLKAKTKTFKELVEEQKNNANDPNAKGSTEETPEVPIEGLPPNMKTAVQKLKAGEVSSVLSLGQAPQSIYVLLRLVDRQPAKKADLTALKTQVEMDYKMDQLASKAMGSMPQNPMMAQQGASMQQQYMQQAATQLMDEIKRDAAKGGTIQVSDPAFETVAKQYTALAAAPAPGAGAVSSGPGGPGGAPAGGGASAPAASAPKQ